MEERLFRGFFTESGVNSPKMELKPAYRTLTGLIRGVYLLRFSQIEDFHHETNISTFQTPSRT